VAALGPKALALAGERSLGALPWLTSPGHTAQAREILGPDPLLVPGQKVVLETDAGTARAIGRDDLKYYLTLPNYTSAWEREGFAQADFADGGSDRLIDMLYAYGTPDEIRARLDQHLQAGADQVAIQPVFAPAEAGPSSAAARAVELLVELAPALDR